MDMDMDTVEVKIRCGAHSASRPIRILHLSDPHFAPETRLGVSRSMGWLEGLRHFDIDRWNALITFIGSQAGCSKIDLVACTGDLTVLGSPRSLRYARAKLLELLRVCGLSEERLVVAPGNHDRFLGYCGNLVKRFVPTLEDVFDGFCGPRLITIRETDLLIYPFDSTEEGFRLLPFANTGRITPRRYNDFNSFMKVHRQGSPASGGRLTAAIALLHHHPLPVPRTRASGWTIMRNGGEFLHHAQEQKVDLVLHGHEHSQYSCRISYGIESSDIVVSGAGTACQSGRQGCSISIVDMLPSNKIMVRVAMCKETGYAFDPESSRMYRLTFG